VRAGSIWEKRILAASLAHSIMGKKDIRIVNYGDLALPEIEFRNSHPSLSSSLHSGCPPSSAIGTQP
jgi:hypothetical protein